MTDKKIIAMRNDVDTLLDNFRVSEAMSAVGEMLEQSGLKGLLNRLENCRETYRYMVHYLLEGARDDGRNKMLSDLLENLRLLADMSVRAVRSVDSPEYYYSVLRFNNYKRERLSDILSEYGKVASELGLAEAADNDTGEIRKQRESIQERLFNTLFTSLGAETDCNDLVRYLNSGYADEDAVALCISAMTLSLLYFYDKAKINSLLDIYDNSESDRIRARALTGILFAMIDNSRRMESDSSLMSRLVLWNDSLETYRHLRELIRIIVGTRDTERVANKMKEEVIPELMKLRPEILRKLREGEVELDASMLENNPEWEEMLDQSGLTKKMQELSEMQSDGADLMMVTFSNLKQFPFFNKAVNWFLPFDSRHTELNLDDEMRKFIDMLGNAGGMVCNSDMYSLALASAQMPHAQRQMIAGQLSAQFEQLNEQIKTAAPNSSTPVFDVEALKAVRDLYRFFKLFRKKDGFRDPFARPLDFTHMPIVGNLMREGDVLHIIGEFYFKRGYYPEALPLFLSLSESEGDDCTIWEKIGFCYQSANDYANAAKAYDKAALLRSPGPWLTKKLAYVNRRLGNHAKAAEYYQSALEMEPDNVGLLMNVGNSLLETGDLAGALTHFYHANYISENNPKALRAIAWVEFLNGNFAKSSDYYGRVISQGASASDYLNAGHAKLMQSDYKEAVNFYRLAAQDSKTELAMAFNNDLDVLQRLGADRVTALLILDSALDF